MKERERDTEKTKHFTSKRKGNPLDFLVHKKVINPLGLCGSFFFFLAFWSLETIIKYILFFWKSSVVAVYYYYYYVMRYCLLSSHLILFFYIAS